jgi:hypothetical protein
MALEIAYAGSKGTHLVGGPALNQLPDALLALGPTALTRQVPNPFLGLIPYGTLSGATIRAGQLLLPYPQYTGVTAANDGNRDTVYHSMNVKLEKRFRQGGTILASYTWARNIGDIETGMGWLEASQLAGIQDNNNPRQERAVSGFDVDQRIIVSYVYDLPIGNGKKFLGNTRGIAEKLVSGWGINGISTFQAGFPLTLNTSSNSTDSFGRRFTAELRGRLQHRGIRLFSIEAESMVQHRLFHSAAFSHVRQSGPDSDRRPPARHRQLRLLPLQEYEDRGTRRPAIPHGVFQYLQPRAVRPPGETLGNAQFGVVSSQLNTPRLIQFALRLNY